MAAPDPPTQEEVRVQLLRLLDGSAGREEVSAWAVQWIAARDPRVDDEVFWKALGNLAGADAVSTDRPWLFGKADFEAWLEELDDSRKPS